jgi:hypothetical protein
MKLITKFFIAISIVNISLQSANFILNKDHKPEEIVRIQHKGHNNFIH